MNSNKATKGEAQHSVWFRNHKRDEFHGFTELGAEKMTGSTVTRYELIQLVKHWATYVLKDHFLTYWSEQPSSSSRWCRKYSLDRIQEIADIIGEELKQAAVDEAKETFGASLDPRVWNLYQKRQPLPAAVVSKMYTGKKVTEADWKASYKKPGSSDKEKNKGLTRGRRKAD